MEALCDAGCLLSNICYPWIYKLRGGMRAKNKAILIRCTEAEAERIRQAARVERRTISGFVLNAVFNRIGAREQALRQIANAVNRPKP
jgi:uncharacterized protein (DUF1778 family)